MMITDTMAITQTGEKTVITVDVTVEVSTVEADDLWCLITLEQAFVASLKKRLSAPPPGARAGAPPNPPPGLPDPPPIPKEPKDLKYIRERHREAVRGCATPEEAWEKFKAAFPHAKRTEAEIALLWRQVTPIVSHPTPEKPPIIVTQEPPSPPSDPPPPDPMKHPDLPPSDPPPPPKNPVRKRQGLHGASVQMTDPVMRAAFGIGEIRRLNEKDGMVMVRWPKKGTTWVPRNQIEMVEGSK